ncbi:MAG: ABC transporter permease subunit [Candidatus Competibacteraceae bacterium]|nr:ABC transporter permease subunit [Candidatus Competibacteraceae bacterium]
MPPAVDVLIANRESADYHRWRNLPGLLFFPPLTLLLLLGPVLAGLFGTLLPAFGYLPALGSSEPSLLPWRQLFAAPGFWHSVWLSFSTGLLATAISLAVVIAFCAGWHGTRLFARLQRLLSPLLAVPHVTVAFGLAFLLTPSGWIMRLFSPWATGFTRPPDLITIQDPYGLSLMLSLVVKEIPFLLLMTLAALNQVDAARIRTVARTLGYGPIAAWLKAVLPSVYPQLRLPIFAVLAYSASVVDVALVMGPTTPPPLAVQLLRWFNDPELSLRFVASAGALLQLLLVIGIIGLWCALEQLVKRLGLHWIRRGRRTQQDRGLRYLAAALLLFCSALTIIGLVGMGIWSLADFWRYPDALPASFSLSNWQRHAEDLVQPIWNTIATALAAALIALVLTLGCLEHEAHFGRRPSNRALWLLYLPLLVPQVAFLFGAQILLVVTDLDGLWLALLWSHLVFVLPYVFLSLSDPYRAWDERYGRTALCLGASPMRVWFSIKLPMLFRPILIALAVGFAVSVGQYLPSLFAGGGRYPTLTTEAVALSTGADRRIIGVYALLQMLAPFVMFSLALLLPNWLFRHRRGLQVSQ